MEIMYRPLRLHEPGGLDRGQDLVSARWVVPSVVDYRPDEDFR